uniref:Putative odorant-binding protein n=1 Tax=Triatoma brasiliensis TaxID=65344 RepID=A0A163AN00_TRIBS|nr:putative odorant-binding protein [Triatoma brasiliensis]
MGPSRIVVLVSTFIVSIMLLITDTHGAMTEAQMKQAMKTVRGMCLGKSGATKEALDKMQEGIFDEEDRNLKCYLGCIMGMMQAVKNNKINLKMVRSQITKMLEPEVGKRILTAFEGCQDTVGEDNCDLSFKFAKCLYDADPSAFIVP